MRGDDVCGSSRVKSGRRASAALEALRSRDSSRVPSNAVLRREPRRRLVRRCAIAADIARLVDPSPGLCGMERRSASSCGISRFEAFAWLIRRKDSLEKREPERLRLWLLVLPDRARGDIWTSKSVVRSSSSIGASGTEDVSSEIDPPAWNSSTVDFPWLWHILPECRGAATGKGVALQPVISGQHSMPYITNWTSDARVQLQCKVFSI